MIDNSSLLFYNRHVENMSKRLMKVIFYQDQILTA